METKGFMSKLLFSLFAGVFRGNLFDDKLEKLTF